MRPGPARPGPRCRTRLRRHPVLRPGKFEVFRFPADEQAPVDRTVDFAETFLGGGTSYQTPLSAAGELLEAEFDDTARMRGDIVMITDDDCGVTEQWTRAWNDTRRRLGFRVFGLVIGAPRAAAADSVLQALCDNLRLIEDLTDVHTTATESCRRRTPG